MNLTLKRKYFTKISTIGELSIDGEFICYTLEDVDRFLENGNQKVQDSTAIPRGTYDLTISMSNRFKKRMPLLLNVPGFEGIRIHAGNTANDTEGCILVGTKFTNDALIGSFAARDKLYSILEKAISENIKITMEIE